MWVESSGGVSGANINVIGFPEAGDAPHVTFAINGAPIYGTESLSFMEQSSLFRLDETIASVEGVIGGPGSVFGKGDKKLETATATIGIRGTGCYIESEEARVYFCLCYGVAEVVPTADPSRMERIETKHHDHPIYIHKGSAMPALVDASVMNHNDAELELLESLVGRRPPFSPYSYR